MDEGRINCPINLPNAFILDLSHRDLVHAGVWLVAARWCSPGFISSKVYV